MADPITVTDLENAKLDAQDLDAVVNGAADINGTGLVPTRTGGNRRSLAKLEAEGQARIDALQASEDAASDFADDAAASAAAAAVVNSAPRSYGTTSGASVATWPGVAYAGTDPTQVAGLLTSLQWRMYGGTGTVTIVLFNYATKLVLKKWSGVAAVNGVNTLDPGIMGTVNLPIGTAVIIATTAGAGTVDVDGVALGVNRLLQADVTGVAEGGTLPAGLDNVAASRPSILLQITPVNAQEVGARVDVHDTNRASETGGYVKRETETYLAKVGITTVDPAATGSSGGAQFSLASATGGTLVSAFVNMNARGAGIIVVARPTDDGKLETVYSQPTGVLPAGGNTIALPGISIPAGSRVGYVSITGGWPASPGFIGRLQASVTPGTITTAVGQKYAWTASNAPMEIGFTMRAPRDRMSVSATARQARFLENRGPEGPRLPTTFMKGTWLPRLAEYDTWKARGVNLMVLGCTDTMEGNATQAPVTDAEAKSLYYIRMPGKLSLLNVTSPGQVINAAALAQIETDVTYDSVSPWCMGIHHWDEPGYAKPREQGTGSPDANTMRFLERDVSRWRKVSGTLPVWLNMAKNVAYPDAMNYSLLNTRGIDLWGVDDYPNEDDKCPWMNATDPSGTKNIFFSTNYGVLLEMMSQETLLSYGGSYARPTLSAGKPLFAYIATSRIRSPRTAPQPWEFRMLAWSCVVAGVIGITYFPQDVTVGGYVNDASDANILTEMTTLHANLAVMQAAGALVDDKVGGRVSYQKRLSAPVTTSLAGTRGTTVPQKSSGGAAVFQAPHGNQMQGGFEGQRIVTHTGAIYYLIVNLLNTAATLNDAEWGISGMTFAAAEVKFLAATDLSTNLFSSSGL